MPRRGPFRRLWAAFTTARGFRRLATINMVLLWFILPSGAFVRLTGSGLGCTEWPLCTAGRIIPASSQHAWIEYTNRIASAIVIVVAIVTAIAVFKAIGSIRTTKIGAVIAAAGSVGPIPLGAITGFFDLHPRLVASHFMLSLIALSGGVVAFLGADDVMRRITRAWSRRPTLLAVLGAAALSTAVITGVLVTSAGPHSGDAKVITRFGMLDDAAYVHVRAVFALLVVAILVGWLMRGRRDDRGLIIPALWFIPAFAAQAIIGEVQWYTQLPWPTVWMHVTVAGIVWTLGTVIIWRLARPIVRRDA